MLPFRRAAVPALLALAAAASPALGATQRGDSKPNALFGGVGNDTINVKGGGRDVVDCGPGLDRGAKDSSDRVRNCEVIG